QQASLGSGEYPAAETLIHFHIIAEDDRVACDLESIGVEKLRHQRVLARVEDVTRDIFHVGGRFQDLLGRAAIEGAYEDRWAHSCTGTGVSREIEEMFAVRKEFRIAVRGLVF